jgi:hypothetical protein
VIAKLTGLFLGAGASYEVGMPLVWELTEELFRWLTPMARMLVIRIREQRLVGPKVGAAPQSACVSTKTYAGRLTAEGMRGVLLRRGARVGARFGLRALRVGSKWVEAEPRHVGRSDS